MGLRLSRLSRPLVEHTSTWKVSLRRFSMDLLLNDRMKLIRAVVQWSVNGQAAIDQGRNQGNYER